MANEAVIIELGSRAGNPIYMTVADGTGIEKGTLLTMSDPRTAAYSSAPAGTGYVPAGIAAAEKVASDGSTKLAVYQSGIFDLCASGSITVGQPVKFCGTNRVMAAVAADVVSGVIVGRALETASDAEVIQVEVQLS